LNILPGDVLFVWGNGLFGEAIEFVTHGPSHCALFLDAETLAEAQADRKTGEVLLSNYLDREVHLEVYRDETLTDEERDKITCFARAHFGLKYDYFAILAELARFELNIPINRFREGKRRICSSFVNDCATAVNRNWSIVSCAPAPIDLLLSGRLTRQGSLKGVGGQCM